jgi:hypothetical protein
MPFGGGDSSSLAHRSVRSLLTVAVLILAHHPIVGANCNERNPYDYGRMFDDVYLAVVE